MLVSRRVALQTMLSGAGVAMLAACAPIGEPTQKAAPTTAPAAPAGAKSTAAPPGAAAPTVAAAPAKPAVAQPKPGGKLRLAMSVDLDASGVEGGRLGPAYTPSVFMLFDRLTAFNSKYEPQPMLAESWDWSADKKQLKLNLRKGAVFHSGREFTSDDVKYNLMRVRDPKVGTGQLVGMSNWFSEFETPDKNTIILKADKPRPTVFDMLEYLNIVDRELADGPNATTQAGGTGPFALGEWVQGDHIRFVKNKNYWQSGKPYLDEINIAIVRDPQAMSVQLEAGSLDAVMNPLVQDGARLQKDSKYQLVTGDPNGLVINVVVNTTQAPFDNKKVRQALNYAIDRQRFIDSVLLNLSGNEISDLPWPAGSPASEPAKNKMYAFNLDKAKSLLSEAGVSGFEMDFIYSNISSELAAFAQIYAGDLAKLGVKLNLKPLDSGTYNRTSLARQFSIGASDSSFAQMEPGTLFQLSGAHRPTGNSAGYENQKYIDLVEASQTEPDLAKRKQIFAELNDLLLEDVFIIPVAQRPWYMVASSRVKDIKWMISQAPVYADMWLDS
jgi:peptide/nickel transport system substrate-binding protein